MKTKSTKSFCISVGVLSHCLFGLGRFFSSMGDDFRTPLCFTSVPSLPAHSYGGRTSPYYLKLLMSCFVAP